MAWCVKRITEMLKKSKVRGPIEGFTCRWSPSDGFIRADGLHHESPSEGSQGLRFCDTKDSFLPSLVVEAPVSFLHKHASNGRVRLMDHPKESDERQEKNGVKNKNKKYNERGCHR